MFKKKECNFCGEKIKDKFEFCPNCGNKIGEKRKKEDLGMLGKNDFEDAFKGMKLPMGFNMIFNSLMKNLTKELHGMDKEMAKNMNNQKGNIMPKKNGISISISTGGNMPPQIRMNDPATGEIRQPTVLHKSKSFSEEAKKKFTKLPREEPETNIRRLSDKIIYEIDLPGVKTIKEVSFIKLENSIEIKAVSENTAYEKVIRIDLPISHYSLEKGKLILELLTKE